MDDEVSLIWAEAIELDVKLASCGVNLQSEEFCLKLHRCLKSHAKFA